LPETAVKQLDNVSVKLKANVYFEGKVISHTLMSREGARRAVGLIYPGLFKFNTDAAERMEIIAGLCRVRLAGQELWKTFGAGESFRVPERSYFEIAVDQGLAEYLCTFEQ